MFSNTTAELSLNIPSKCIDSIPNDTSNHRFLVGTCTVSTSSSYSSSPYMEGASNSLYLLRYHEEMNELAVDAQLDFDDEEGSGEIWSMSSCPMDKTLVVICRNKGNGNGSETALWRIPEKAMKEDEIDYYPDDNDAGIGNSGENRNYSSDINEKLEKIWTFQSKNDLNELPDDTAGDIGRNTVLKGRISNMQWNPGCSPHSDDGSIVTGGGINFLTVDYNINGNPTITTWDMNTSSVIAVNQLCIPSNERKAVINSMTVPNPPRASWDPHNTNLCAITCGLNVSIVDNRSGNVELTLKNCHKFGVTDLDHNPNKPNVLSTCGQDSLVKFWDLRYSHSSAFNDLSNKTRNAIRQHPLRILQGGHSHWITRVKYNSFHDQLLLSGGTDGLVNLWRVSSISSAPLLDLGNTAEVDLENKDLGLPSAFSGFDDDDEEKIRNALNDDADDLSFAGQQNTENNPNQNDGADGGNSSDIRVANMEMRDAIYDLAWGVADPWIYVTLGYDGNVVLNHVPSKEKYKILL